MSADKLPHYLLLTPGPLSTSDSVRAAMLYDSCTWDEDYKSKVNAIRKTLLQIANCDQADYTSVLMQGSGTFGVESVLGSCINKHKHRLLILVNGVYGKRMVAMAQILELPHLIYEVPENCAFDACQVETLLTTHHDLTHIAMVHCETTTGILNDLTKIAELAKNYQQYFIVDAMSSFGGIQFDMQALNIDFLVSSANKCLQGVPGFSFVICKKKLLTKICAGNAKSLALDLYGQWLAMEQDPGKWRYTSPTHTVLAFLQALTEFAAEGGVASRGKRYAENQKILTEGMQALGFDAYIERALQSPIITTFIQPERVPGTAAAFNFLHFYAYLKAHGFVIYPGKLTNKNSFRIGSIGHLFASDIKRFLQQVNDYIAAS